MIIYLKDEKYIKYITSPMKESISFHSYLLWLKVVQKMSLTLLLWQLFVGVYLR